MNLYEITADLAKVNDLIDDADGEITPEVEEVLAGLEVALTDKVQGYVVVIRKITMEADALKAEEARLTKRRKNRERTVADLRARLAESLKLADTPKVKTLAGTVSLTKKYSVTIDDVDALTDARPELVKVVTTRTPDKRAILADIKSTGEPIDGCTLVANEGITIR